MMRQRPLFSKICTVVLTVALVACAANPRSGPSDGVRVNDSAGLKNMVPASQLEQTAARQYGDMKVAAGKKNALAPENSPELLRLRAIAKQILPHASIWNPDAQNWKWEINLFVTDEIGRAHV